MIQSDYMKNNDLPELISQSIGLKDLQAYAHKMFIARGFEDEDPAQQMVVLMEEVGELARAIRKEVGMKFSNTTTQSNLADEIADVQIVLLNLASTLDVDVVSAVIAKEQINRARTWS